MGLYGASSGHLAIPGVLGISKGHGISQTLDSALHIAFFGDIEGAVRIRWRRPTIPLTGQQFRQLANNSGNFREVTNNSALELQIILSIWPA